MGAKNLVVIIFGVVLVGAGFVSLARGSITLAPILLVAGYCLVIPVGIAIGAPRDGRQSGPARDEGANSSAG
jgi:hypothetical protein